ncbi:MAG: hypothetical protein MUE98_08025 [Rhodobacteraceae bacterium]|jgi:hypothetical protein|nr:hypothetical protein [Paracoccaceae bacterium]
MSGLEDRRRALAEADWMQERTEAAMASIRAREAARRGEGEAILVAVALFGEAAQQGRLARAVNASRAICIIAAGVIPVALFWTQVWPGG